MTVRDKIAMITGAGGGLGSEMARLLCENGAKVFILDLDAEKGQATADDIVAFGGLDRPTHREADRRRQILEREIGDLHQLSYAALRYLQDPSMTREFYRSAT